MLKRNFVFPLFSLFLLASCSGAGKKVLIMASGKVSTQGNTVTLQPGTSHTEVIFEPPGDNISIVAPSGNKEVAVKETVTDHQMIMEFMKNRNPEGARSAMKIHILRALKDLGIE